MRCLWSRHELPGAARRARALVLPALVACADSREPATAADTGRPATPGPASARAALTAPQRLDGASEDALAAEHAALRAELRAELAAMREANAVLRRDVVALWQEIGRRSHAPPPMPDADRVRPDPSTLPE